MVDPPGCLALLHVVESEHLVTEKQVRVVAPLPDDVHAELLDEEPAGLVPVAYPHVDVVEPEETEVAGRRSRRHEESHGSCPICVLAARRARAGPVVGWTGRALKVSLSSFAGSAGEMPNLRDHEAELDRLLARVGRRTRFAEVLAQTSHGEMVTVDSKTHRASTIPRIAGATVRAWSGTRWVEAAASGFERPTLDRAAESLERDLTSATGGHEPPGTPATTVGSAITPPARPMSQVGLERQVEVAKDCFRWTMSVPGIKNAQCGVAWWADERLYLNTAGARCHHAVERVRGGVVAIAIENGRSEYDYEGTGGIGGVELLDPLTEEKAHKVANSTIELLGAPSPPTGPMSVLLDHGTTGTFAHESFGHGTEADQFVRDRSYLKPILGQTVGPESLTIWDDGSMPGAWGSVPFDDEGHPGEKTMLIDHGRFVGALHDRESAAAMGAKATGNTRRSDFLSRAYVRMTNICIEPGDWTLEELVEAAGDGVLLEHWTSGMEDPLGGQMQLKVRRGHRIEHGKLAGPVTSMALSGSVLGFLKDIRGLSKMDRMDIETGFCGKGHGDYLPTGDGGPYLLSRAVVGPA
jgi:TldD protein